MSTGIDLTSELMGGIGVSFADDVDKAAETSGQVPPGKYHARVDGATEKGSPGNAWRDEVWFLILAGPFAGRKVKYTIWRETSNKDKEGNPKDPQKLATDKARIINEFDHSYGVLGIKRKVFGDEARKFIAGQLNGKPGATPEQIARIADEASKRGVYVAVAGKYGFRDALGAECVIKTTLRPSNTDGDDRKFAEVEQFGVLAFNDPKAKGAIMAQAGATHPPIGSTPTPAARDLSDLV